MAKNLRSGTVTTRRSLLINMAKQPAIDTTPYKEPVQRDGTHNQSSQWRQQTYSHWPNRRTPEVATEAAEAVDSMVTIDAVCPQCNHPSIEALELSDGRVTYCAQCGYRGLSPKNG